jgi:hypothetical protein
MRQLPEGFAEALSSMLDPADRNAAAEIIESATMLDDAGLLRFLRLFAERVRASRTPIKADELRRILQQAAT